MIIKPNFSMPRYKVFQGDIFIGWCNEVFKPL
jgi:hypothetical protein